VAQCLAVTLLLLEGPGDGIMRACPARVVAELVKQAQRVLEVRVPALA